MRSGFVLALVGSLQAALIAGACATPFQGQDNELLDPSGGSGPVARDGGQTSSSSGGSSPTEAGAPDATTDGAAPDEGPCDPTHGVGVLSDVAGLVSADYRMGARLSADELHVVFLQVRDPTVPTSPMDVYTASRTSTLAPFGPPQKVNAAAAAIGVSLSANGLSMYFTPRQATGTNGVQITTRSSTDAPFTGAAGVAGVPGYSYNPFATRTDTLLFAQFPEGSASSIWSSTISGTQALDPVVIFGLGSNDIDFPALSSDGTELFYTEHFEPSGQAYRRAVRNGDRFVASPLTGLDEAQQEVTWVSADACRLYVTDWRSFTLQIARRAR